MSEEYVKISKEEAHYTDRAPEEYKNEPCRRCTYFEREAAKHCLRVYGFIQPGGHCKLWKE